MIFLVEASKESPFSSGAVGAGIGAETSLTGDFLIISGVASRIGIGVVDSLVESISVFDIIIGFSSLGLLGLDWKYYDKI